jgi:4-amino-4-deoxy-L-arabinose transferase-like glycosyltransferase
VIDPEFVDSRQFQQTPKHNYTMVQQLKRLLTYPAFITLFAFAARMLVLAYDWKVLGIPVKSSLAYGYELGRVASAVAAGRGFSSPLRFMDTGPTAWFTPIYPCMVAGIFKIWGIFSDESKLIIEATNCAFVALTVIPIYGIAHRTFGKNIAVGAAWLWVFLPTSLVFPVIWIWDTSLTALVFSLIFWATLAMREAKTILPWAGYGALWAIGGLINPSLLSLLPFLLAWAVWPSRHDRAAWARYSAATLLVFAIALVPWTVRNYRVFGKFIVLRSNFGLELWLGNNPNVPDMWSPWLHPNDSREEADKYARMGEIAFMAEKQQEAFHFMRTHPAETLQFIFRRFVNHWLGITDAPADMWAASPLYYKAFIVMNFLLALFALLGALFAYRSRPVEAQPYLMVLLIFPLIFYLTHTSLRYRFPMDPLMMILAAYGVAHPITQWLERASPQEGTAAPAPPVPTI